MFDSLSDAVDWLLKENRINARGKRGTRDPQLVDLQRVYNSEINFNFGGIPGGMFWARLGDEQNGFKASYRNERLVYCAEWIVAQAEHKYPRSLFTDTQKKLRRVYPEGYRDDKNSLLKDHRHLIAASEPA